MNWYVKVLNKYAVFSGRARRKEYWYFFLFNFGITFVLTFIDGMVGLYSYEIGLGFFGFLYLLAVFVPGIAVAVRRLHDTGRSAWWLFVLLIPFVGAIVLLVFLVLDSDPGENEYGKNPKSEST